MAVIRLPRTGAGSCIRPKYIIIIGEGRDLISLHLELLSELLGELIFLFDLTLELLELQIAFNVLLLSLGQLIEVDVSAIQETIWVTIWRFLIAQIGSIEIGFVIGVAASLSMDKWSSVLLARLVAVRALVYQGGPVVQDWQVAAKTGRALSKCWSATVLCVQPQHLTLCI